MTHSHDAQLQQHPDRTFVVTLILHQDEIESARQSILKKFQAEFETKGFRKGKAPLNVVEANVSTSKLIEEVLSELASHQYSHVIQDKKLHPIIEPQVKILNPPLEFDKDWQVEITGCELPEIKLDKKYQSEIKKINIEKLDDNQKLTKTMTALVTHSTVTIPEILLMADVNHKLADLVDQTKAAGMTVQSYLKSRNQTLEQYQQQLMTQVKNEWITNLAIDRIAKDENLTVSDQEADNLLAKNPALKSNPNLVYYLLTQQKVFDFLKKL